MENRKSPFKSTERATYSSPLSRHSPYKVSSLTKASPSLTRCRRGSPDYSSESDFQTDSENEEYYNVSDYISSGPDTSGPLSSFILKQLATDIEEYCGIEKIIENSSSRTFLPNLLDKRPGIYGPRKSRRRHQI